MGEQPDLSQGPEDGRFISKCRTKFRDFKSLTEVMDST